MRLGIKAVGLMALGGLSGLLLVQTPAQAQKDVMGQVQFQTTSKAVRTSGVWIDGQYVGYLGELKGSNRLRLLPGNHEISVRQAGYSDFSKKLVIEPRMVVDVRVSMERDPRFVYPDPKTSS